MMFLYSIQFCNPNGPCQVTQYLHEQTLPVCVPPYENKPFCLYVMNLMVTLDCSPDFSAYLLNHVLLCLRREETIRK